MKKIISLFISLVMLLSITAGLNLTVNAETLTGKCGVNVTYSFDTSTGVLTISGTGDMADYSLDNDSPFCDNSNIKSVIIENGVTSIGESAFNSCTSLTSVTIPDSVTSIGERAFSDCTSLVSVTIPNSVTSIGDGAFEDCNNLASITVNSNNNNYSSQDGVLFNKNKTTLIQYPMGNTRTSYTIPNSVTSIGDFAFQYCTSLVSVTIPNSVTSIGGYAFYSCDNLTSVTIPNSVTSIGDHAFGYNFAGERVKGFTIYGTLGTEAERYANDNGFTFMDVASKPSEPSTEPTTQPTTQPTPQPSVPATQPEQTTQAQSNLLKSQNQPRLKR